MYSKQKLPSKKGSFCLLIKIRKILTKFKNKLLYIKKVPLINGRFKLFNNKRVDNI